MKFVFLFLGKTKAKHLDAAIVDYATRLKRYVPVELVVLKEKYKQNASDKVIRRTGSDLLLAKCVDRGVKVALDLSGTQFDSPELAGLVQGWQDQGTPNVYFLIGGHLGLSGELVQAADVVWSLSRLTFTHEMTRVLILEQLYRAWTINSGQQYHK